MFLWWNMRIYLIKNINAGRTKKWRGRLKTAEWKREIISETYARCRNNGKRVYFMIRTETSAWSKIKVDENFPGFLALKIHFVSAVLTNNFIKIALCIHEPT